MIKRILVGLGGTAYTPVAIQRAISLAKSQAAEVTGVTVLDARRVRHLGGAMTPTGGEADAIGNRGTAITEDRLAQSIRDFEAVCRGEQIKYRVVRESGDAFMKLIELARYHDLMIFGLRSVFEYDFLCPDPQVLLMRLVGAGVRPLIAVSQQFRQIHRVLIAYSGTMESAKAMKRFVQLGLWSSARLKIMTFQVSDDEGYRLTSDAADYCQAQGYTVDRQSNPGEARHMLLAAAKLWQADMIVMGNSARSVLLRHVLGDTLQDVLQHTDIPLFLAQ
ncbi:MAG: universal stress protein [Planctomycetia bacterium]|nr:universal stress protein [Planctomycetia bacterium]